MRLAVQRNVFPSPLVGEGASSHNDSLAQQTPLLARLRYRSRRATLSRKGRGEERVRPGIPTD